MRAIRARAPSVVIGCTAVLVLGLGGSACADPGTGSRLTVQEPPVPVVASTNVYGDVVKQIGSDKVDVVSIISDPAQDPHSYEASTRNQLELAKAKVVVENGGGYDDFVGRMLRGSGNSSAEVVDAVDASGKRPAADGAFNEHVWYDLPTMGKVADRIADALAKAAPADGAEFRQNAKTFKDDLAGLQEETKQINSRHAGTPVAVTEPVPLYLTEASGLVNKTPADFSEAVEEGDEVSPQSLRDTLALFTDRQVEVLVYNEQTAGPQTEKVEKAAVDNDIPVVAVTETLPEGEDYVSWMASNIDALKNALDR
ncbi:zinc ABC transporter substrate-binding protein [Streptomyces sp. NPDC096193]|uniref:metal ABC transporter solute-binding protein, Zn/Mn family n=1 Tax=Streptomyces sp. NPDC096193 TaxID=3155821 RepID=UPI0033285E23